ncbi:MAG: hypothetical protein U0528_01370 [Anaerolineae bacterium]
MGLHYWGQGWNPCCWFDGAQYIRQSIVDPTAYVVDGYQPIMPKTLAKPSAIERLIWWRTYSPKEVGTALDIFHSLIQTKVAKIALF